MSAASKSGSPKGAAAAPAAKPERSSPKESTSPKESSPRQPRRASPKAEAAAPAAKEASPKNAASPKTSSPKGSPKLCRDYMNNECAYGDECKFNHDETLCRKAWVSACTKGDKCKYSHNFPTPPPATTADKKGAKAGEKDLKKAVKANEKDSKKSPAAAGTVVAETNGRRPASARNGKKAEVAAESGRPATAAPRRGAKKAEETPVAADGAGADAPKSRRGRNRRERGAKADGAATKPEGEKAEASTRNRRDLLKKPLIANSIGELIGKTPMLKLSKKTNTTEANILLKLESENPMASVKDRLAYSIIKNAEKDGKIKPGETTLVEGTSGNTGIALAQLGAAMGYKVIIVMPDTMSQERRALIRIFGAKLVLTQAKYGIKGANALVEKIVASTPGAYWANQFGTEYNAKVHRETTGPEIWQQTRGKVAAVVSGAGTGGTVTGIAEFLKSINATTKIIAVEPEESQVIAGKAHNPHRIQGIGAGFIPEVLKKELLTETIAISSDNAIAQARALAQAEGLFLGFSSGAAVAAALELGKREEFKGQDIVVIIPSFGERYLSTALYQDVTNEVKNQTVIDPTEEGIETRI